MLFVLRKGLCLTFGCRILPVYIKKKPRSLCCGNVVSVSTFFTLLQNGVSHIVECKLFHVVVSGGILDLENVD